MNKLFRTITDSSSHNDGVVQLHPHQDIEHKIVIEGLELMISIGILPEEKANKQRVIINAELWMKPQAHYADDINNTVSYAGIIEEINEIVKSRHFDLVETLALEISDMCLNHNKIVKTAISVKKPDIIKNVKNVGFYISREK